METGPMLIAFFGGLFTAGLLLTLGVIRTRRAKK